MTAGVWLWSPGSLSPSPDCSTPHQCTCLPAGIYRGRRGRSGLQAGPVSRSGSGLTLPDSRLYTPHSHCQETGESLQLPPRSREVLTSPPQRLQGAPLHSTPRPFESIPYSLSGSWSETGATRKHPTLCEARTVPGTASAKNMEAITIVGPERSRDLPKVTRAHSRRLVPLEC